MKRFSTKLIFWGLLCLFLNSECYALSDNSKNSLTMGIFPRRNAKLTFELFKPMVQYLEAQLGRKIELVTSKDFETFWQGIENQRYDIVHFNQYHYAVSHYKYGYEVILKNNEFGESTIAGSIIVRADSNINNITDLKGKRIVFGGSIQAMQSYIVATYLLRKAGLRYGDYVEEFAKNPPNAIFSSYYQQSDAAGAGDKVLRLDVVQNRVDISKMKYLIKGEQLPHLPWAVKFGIDTNLKKRVQKLLSQLGDSVEGKKVLESAHLTGLEVATDSEYDKHREIIKFVFPKLDIK